jgi:sulfur-oxidizing protein SoxB
MTALRTGAPIDPGRNYTVAGWASVNEGTEGPPVWELVERYVSGGKVIRVSPNSSIKISGI